MPEQLSLPDLAAPTAPPPPPPPQPTPQPTANELQRQAMRIWAASPALRRQFKTMDALLAHPRYGAWLLMCARAAMKARDRRQQARAVAPPAQPTTNGLTRQD